ncbi:MAG: VWA domain-containing protein [Gammaproteobacteria bacterium]|nr:VWA domain-containing protein [Gammaproteobacteria bacterium]
MKDATPRARLLLSALLLTLSMTGRQAVAQTTPDATPKHHEIRILIDVSGSMKVNDPENLRQPALRLISTVIPDGYRAGVWTFGEFVNMLIPPEPINAGWRTRVAEASQQIASHGLFTNIPAALDDASWDWLKPPTAEVERSLILLTDGLVDIDRDVTVNRKARDKLLNSTLPGLEKGGVKVYGIALSENADIALLQQLAERTHGSFEQIQNAEQLERVFFRMFERATQPATVPLSADNEFDIDHSITELTLLVFREARAPDTEVIQPDTRVLNKDTRRDPNVSWHHESRYDLVTIRAPLAGHWRINAPVNEDNRAMVVTDLQLLATQPPPHLLEGDPLTVSIMLADRGQAITRKDFLRFVKVNVTQDNGKGRPERWRVSDDGRNSDAQAGDGIYTLTVNKALPGGQHQLVINAEGKTFRRERRYTITVHNAPALAQLTPTDSSAHSSPSLVITPITDLIDPASMKVSVLLKNAKGEERLEPIASNQEWRLDLGERLEQAEYTALIDISGKRPNGKAVAATLPAMKLARTARKTAAAVANPTAAAPATKAAQHPAAKNSNTAHQTKGTPRSRLPLFWIEVAAFNILLALALYFGYRRWKGVFAAKKKPWDDLDHDESESTQPTDADKKSDA